MKRFYLVGKNIEMSLSPYIHAIIYAELGIKAEYLLFEPKESECILPYEFDGLNITYPFKESVLSLLDCDKSGCGSVNTVKKISNNAKKSIHKSVLYGYSTDGDGFILDAKRRNLDLCNVLIIGTGGAARSIAAALNRLHLTKSESINHINQTIPAPNIHQKNVKITVISRSKMSATSFSSTFNTEVCQNNHILSDFTHLKQYSLVINCTPSRLDFLGKLPYYDIKYNGEGHGIGMLIYQAILSDCIFFDTDIDTKLFETIHKLISKSI